MHGSLRCVWDVMCVMPIESMCPMCGICMLGMRCGWIVCMMLCGMCEGEGNNIVCKPLWAERVLFWNRVVQI